MFFYLVIIYFSNDLFLFLLNFLGHSCVFQIVRGNYLSRIFFVLINNVFVYSIVLFYFLELVTFSSVCIVCLIF